MQAGMHRASLLLAAILAVGVSGAALWHEERGHPAPSGKPERIVSLNLCADQLVLALADRGQIAGLTRNAADPEMSGEAGKARGLRILSNSAEEILELDPDLVVGIPARRSASIGVLNGQKYTTLDLKTANTLVEIYASIRETATAVGHPERGSMLIADMESQLAAIPRPGKGRVAAYYQRRGFMTGTGTLIDDLMKRVGVVNLAAKLGKPALSQLRLGRWSRRSPPF